ncbi:energy transducer TonB [Sphingomonadaceae bacterium G21617-S1]|jgi:protein TonB|uniref:energy transducer TonB n=1 Tax=Rhizorhabdus sp. TaxID=1968843 RepID=UPI001986970B|nr:energy transducer TonB [Rhizorhabdus sp.]MBD3760297.1 TonB family protein [Rhizorhabdus sp.]MCZ4340815.1 energy transducer TonB [Sphingomonadaceae bacterium G21617-S1]
MKARYTRLLAAACAALAVLAATSPARAADAAFDAKVMKLVSTFYSYPRSAELRHEEGRAKVKIVIAGSGKTISIELVESSGSQILDREAVRIPGKVGTFPPPPGGAPYTVIVPIRWQMG